MSGDLETLVRKHVEARAPLERESHVADWKLACTSEDQWEQESARLQIEVRRLLSDRDTFLRLREAIQDPAAQGDQHRQAQLLHADFARNQTDPALLEQLVALETRAEGVFGRFRPQLDGRSVTENEVRAKLRDSNDVDERRRTWEASKQIGHEIAPLVREMVALRNRSAVEAGYSDCHTMALELQEIDPGFLFGVLERLEDLTREPFEDMIQSLFARVADRFGTTPDAIRPWHLADPFFQEAVPSDSLTLDRFYEGADLVELTRRGMTDLGFDVSDVLARSDLFPRDRKNQHAFCTHIDRMADDVRVLCNVVPDANWMDTMLHEFGHAVYDLHLGRDLPWLLREPAHTLSTEAIALLFGRLATNPDWMIRMLDAPADEIDALRAPLRRYAREKQLLFPRWVMVMVYFERELYSNPEQDLNSLWWDLVERFQLVPRPEGRNEPDWACKIHVGLAPVYYQNYLLGDLMASQLDSALTERIGTSHWFERKETAEFLVSELFRDGARRPWNEALRVATGSELDPAHYVEQYVTVSA